MTSPPSNKDFHGQIIGIFLDYSSSSFLTKYLMKYLRKISQHSSILKWFEHCSKQGRPREKFFVVKTKFGPE